MGALDNPRVIANCKTLSAETAPGTCWFPMEASKIYIGRFLCGARLIRDRVGGQTIAAILVEHCGWERNGSYVLKPGKYQPTMDGDAVRKILAEMDKKAAEIRRINMRIKQQAKGENK